MSPDGESHSIQNLNKHPFSVGDFVVLRAELEPELELKR
jgi:hypothetical protein